MTNKESTRAEGEGDAGGFQKFAAQSARWTGRPIAFWLAFLMVAVWLVTGPVFGFSDTWQLVINTATNLITFIMVFLIQSTQNRDSQALQLKLDELLRVTNGARNALLDVEDVSDEQLSKIKNRYALLAHRSNGRADGAHSGSETAQGSPKARRTPDRRSE